MIGATGPSATSDIARMLTELSLPPRLKPYRP